MTRTRSASSKEELKSSAGKMTHDPTIGRIELLPISSLKPDPKNPRKHSRQQIRALSRSMDKLGFNTVIAVDKDLVIKAGHARVEAAKLLGHEVVPVLHLDHLTAEEARAFMLADNKLGDRSSWDDELLAVHLKEFSGLDLNFDIEAATGFEAAEIDTRIQLLENPDAAEEADEFEFATGPAVSKLDDLWTLGGHRLYCGNALEEGPYKALFANEKAAATFTDPPYNVRINGHVSGTGKIKHREFAMAAGEMSEAEHAAFLTASFTRVCSHTAEGALLYFFMDWRHTMEIQTAARAASCDQVNLCVWVKSNGGLGSLYRSRHELVFVFKNGKGPHLNNVQLGRFGRNRTNVWSHPGVTNFVRQGTKRALEYHPTVKPILLVSDAILDSTARNDIVLDPFLGSGTTLLSAQRTERRCFGIELDPLYVDTTIERWQCMTGCQATDLRRETFDEVKLQRSVVA